MAIKAYTGERLVICPPLIPRASKSSTTIRRADGRKWNTGRKQAGSTRASVFNPENSICRSLQRHLGLLANL